MKQKKILTEATSQGVALVPIRDLVIAVVSLAQTICEKKYYPYQVQLAYRMVESLLLRDGETVTALLARQSGKTEVVSSIVAALLIILPYLAKRYPHDWRLNLTDESGNYRGFLTGVRIGIYAPRMDQASIMYERVRTYLQTKTAKKLLSEMMLEMEVSNGTTVRLTNGSRCLCESASEQSKIEGETHDLLIAEEAQDITDIKMKKSIHPMVSSRNGTLVKIGTSTAQRCDFYDSIKTNERSELGGGPKNHFFYPYQVCEKFNSLYAKYIAKEKIRIGETSDEFQMAYECFAGDTLVYLPDGTTSSISSLKEGDNVIGASGNIRRVTYKACKGTKATVRVRFYGAPDVVCTSEHLFLTEAGWVAAKDLCRANRVRLAVPLLPRRFRSVPLPEATGSRVAHNRQKLPRSVNLSDELGELLGWYVAEGCVNNANKSDICFSLGFSETEEAARIQFLLSEVFGLSSSRTKCGSVWKIQVCCLTLGEWLISEFGHGAANKRLPSWFFQSPASFLQAYLRAYWLGDGCYTERNTAAAGSVSLTLTLQHQFILRSFGVLSSYHRTEATTSVIEGRLVNCAPSYQIHVYGLRGRNLFNQVRSKRQTAELARGFLLGRVKSVTPDVTQPVWDIEVEHDHSFCLPSATVHNCKWLFERGMFVTQEQLFHKQVALIGDSLFSTTYPYGLPAGSPYSLVVGIDWGRMYDSTVLTVMAVDWNSPVETVYANSTNGQLKLELYKSHIVNWLEWQGDNYEVQFHEIVHYLQSLGPSLKKVVTDSNTAGQPIFDRLVSVFEETGIEIVPFNFQERKKSDAYKSFYAAICGRRVTFPASKAVRLTLPYRKFVHEMLELRKSYKRGVMHVSHPTLKGAHDDFCFPATALVETEYGQVAISEIKVGMRVWTRKGLRRVTFAGQTGVKPVIRVGNFVATANHPVYVVSKDTYVSLDTVRLTDTVLLWRQAGINQKQVVCLPEPDSSVCGQKQSQPCMCVTNAETLSHPDIILPSNFAVVPVGEVTGNVSTIRAFAEGTPVPVFNLTVEDANEYFCQGILVHNCDSAVLAQWGTMSPPSALDLQGSDNNFFYQ